MQILHWLFKRAQEQERKRTTFNLFHQKQDINEQSGKGIKIRVLNHDGSYKRTKRFLWSKHGYKNLKIFSYLYRKDIPKACFFRTLNLKRISSMKMKKEEESSRAEATVNKTDSTSHGGNKVLPITHEAPLSTSAGKKDQCDKKKPISRMKELLRWAAKTEKGGKFYGKKVLMFRRRGNLKAVQDDDQTMSGSPKISFRWDVESCSTTSSAYSAFSMASSTKNGQNKIATSSVSIPHSESGHTHTTCRKANWITTDSECM
ncbi:hypothetical protein P8452_64578 [Trifolium repens]|nr:hypothetical protein P8452_64578 [Trifolium repens]